MPLAWLGLGFSLGLFWGAAADLPPLGLALLLAGAGGGYLVARSAKLPIGGAALLAVGLLLGALRVGPDVLDPDQVLEASHGERVELTGTINGVAEPVGNRIRFRLEVAGTRASGPATAVVWAIQNVPRRAERSFPFLEHGDRVTVLGDIDAPTRVGGFDYPEHLAARGVSSVMTNAVVIDVVPAAGLDLMRWVHSARGDLARSIERYVPEPQAALTNALILGLRGGLTARVNEDFRAAGLSHLLAVSGLHVGILLAIVLGVSARVIGRHRLVYLVPPLLLLWLYILMVGAPPSAVRAGLMGSLFVLALATGRASVPVNALGLAAFAILALHPAALWDRSFQLSFAAMAGVLLIGLPLARRALRSSATASPYRRAALQSIVAPMAVSSGAVVGSLPLVAFNFGQVPLLSIPATLVAMPFVPPLLVAGLATAVLGTLAAPLGAIAGLAPAALGYAIVAIARLFSSLPGATVEAQITAEWVWAGYATIAAGIAVVLRERWVPTARSFVAAVWLGPRNAMQTALVIVGLATIAAVPWASIALDRGDGLLHVYFLDVGQGDATLIVSPAGATVLIDGGGDPRQTIQAIDSRLPPGRTLLDAAVLTHPDADHANGLLELARRGRIRFVLTPPLVDPDRRAWKDELARLSVPATQASAGMTIAFDDGLTLEVLHPPDPLVRGTGADVNNNSVTVMVRWRGATLLLTGDLHAEAERILLRTVPSVDADVLQVGHHGSRTSTAPAFLEAVSPLAAVISVGAGNQFGHPADEVVERLGQAVGQWLFQTSTDGTIELVSDGERWFVASNLKGS